MSNQSLVFQMWIHGFQSGLPTSGQDIRYLRAALDRRGRILALAVSKVWMGIPLSSQGL